MLIVIKPGTVRSEQLDFGMLTVLPECALVCLEQSGAAGVADPALLAAGGVFRCAIDPAQCGGICTD